MATPNLSKLLLDGVKSAGVKVTKKESPSKRDYRVLDDTRVLAHAFYAKDGKLRVYVRATKLPAKLAKSFKATKSSGYAITVSDESEVKLVVEAMVHASGEDA